ncbi:MAG: Gfo/Idh/MocA family oxidoreductase, partial [Candidatus Bathyarchaeia archaeon]
DLVLYLLGNPRPISVSAMTFRGVGETKVDVVFDVEEHATVFVRFDNGCVLTLEKAWAANMENTDEIRILGSKGGLKLISPQVGGGYVSYYTEQNGNCVVSTLNVPQPFPIDISINVVKDFVKACLEGTRPRTTGEDGLLIMQIMEMAYLSAKLGREMTYEEFMKMQKM